MDERQRNALFAAARCELAAASSLPGSEWWQHFDALEERLRQQLPDQQDAVSEIMIAWAAALGRIRKDDSQGR